MRGLGVLGASALTLMLAACTAHAAHADHENERVEPVELEDFAPARSDAPNPIPQQIFTPAKLQPRPPYGVFKRANGELHVLFEKLEPLATPDPTRQKLLTLKAARPRSSAWCSIDFCVNEKGRVVDAKGTRGSQQLARLYIERMARWRFTPYEFDGRKTRVCTSRKFFVHFSPDQPPG